MRTPSQLSVIASCLLLLIAACGDDEPADRDAGEDGGTSPHDASSSDDAGDASMRGDSAIEDDGSVATDASSGDGGNDAGSDFPHPGTRLVPLGYAWGDVVQVRGIYDRELERECTYVQTTEPGAEEGTYHCVPIDFGEIRYTDDGCTDEVVRMQARDECQIRNRSPIVRAASISSCGELTTVTRRLDLEAPLEVETVYMRAYADGECQPETVENAEIFATLPDPLSDLVTAEVERVPTAEPGLDIEIFRGADGSRFGGELYWSDGEPCQPHMLGPTDAEQPCLPQALTRSENVYADDMCTEPIFTGTAGAPLACDPEVPEWRWGTTYALANNDCFYVDALWELGEETAETFSAGSECMSFEPPAEWHTFPALVERPLSEVPAVENVRIGDERLQLEHFAAQDGSVIKNGFGWWDVDRDQLCDPRLFEDGTTRCVHIDFVTHDGLFADDGCTVPAYTTIVEGCNPPPDAPRMRAVQEEQDCATVITQVFELELHVGEVFAITDGCMPATVPDGQAAFVDGAELSPEAFAELEPVGD